MQICVLNWNYVVAFVCKFGYDSSNHLRKNFNRLMFECENTQRVVDANEMCVCVYALSDEAHTHTYVHA